MFRSRRLVVGIVGLAVVSRFVVGVRADERDNAEPPGSKAQREARLSVMRERAAEFEVNQTGGGQRQHVPLRNEPVFRYTDQPRGFIDATLWCWVSKGRPVAMMKVEATANARAPYWQFCVASLADGPIDVSFPTGRRLAAPRAGVVLRPFDNAPDPGDRPTARLRQMKELIARFAATILVDGKESLKQEMRLLPSPIHRYGDLSAGLVDGVIFGLTTNGTNPDMLIVIELRKDGETGARWDYGIVKMTYAEVHIRLDQGEIYSSPITEPLETWTYFQMPRKESFADRPDPPKAN